MYTSIIPFGDDLLGLGSDGDLWRYKFDLRGKLDIEKISPYVGLSDDTVAAEYFSK